jgi:hypothetical protein
MDLHLQMESRKGENVPKQKKIPTKQLKSKNNFEKKTKGRNHKPNNGHLKIQK